MKTSGIPGDDPIFYLENIPEFVAEEIQELIDRSGPVTKPEMANAVRRVLARREAEFERRCLLPKLKVPPGMVAVWHAEACLETLEDEVERKERLTKKRSMGTLA